MSVSELCGKAIGELPQCKRNRDVAEQPDGLLLATCKNNQTIHIIFIIYYIILYE